MIYLSTYLKVKKMSQEDKEELAKLFEVSVDNLKTISPWRWNYMMKTERFEDYYYRKLDERYAYYESYEAQYLNGKLKKSEKRLLKHNYNLWKSDGYHGLDKYLMIKKDVLSSLNDLYIARTNGCRTNDYDKYFQTPLTKYKPKAEIYEYENTIYIVQNYFAINFYDMEHMFRRGLTYLLEDSFLFHCDLEGSVYPWGTKEWVLSRVMTEEQTIFKGKKVVFYMYLAFTQSGNECVLSPSIFPKFGPYEINQTNDEFKKE